MPDHSISIIIPAFNEGPYIVDTLESVKPYADEVIVINDASTDDTASIATAAGARTIIQPAHKGYIPAIKRGFSEANGDIVVTMDADGEFPADKIPELIQPILDGDADMVQGHRNAVPRPSERLLTWLAQHKADVGDSGTGFRALRTPLARGLELHGRCICGIFSLEVLARGGRITEIPIDLKMIQKPRKIAWFHAIQCFHVLRWLFRTIPSKNR
jgi:glycosyltransferase involved in cell wall biosynthesis